MIDKIFIDITLDQVSFNALIALKQLELKEDGSYGLIQSRATSWFDEWYELWPKGIKSGGYLVRSDPKNCKVKMIKFRKSYPEFTPEIIIEGTQSYLSSLKKKDYAFIQIAHYFINKDNNSTLYSYCAEVVDNVGKPKALPDHDFTKHI